MKLAHMGGGCGLKSGLQKALGVLIAVLVLAALLSAVTPIFGSAPRVIDVSPPPADMIVDGSPLQEIVLTFDRPITAAPGSVTLRSQSNGPIQNVLVDPPATPTDTLTINFPAAHNDRLTLVVGHGVTGEDGLVLDGEVANPQGLCYPWPDPGA